LIFKTNVLPLKINWYNKYENLQKPWVLEIFVVLRITYMITVNMIKKLTFFNSFIKIIKKLHPLVNLITGRIKILHLYLIKEFLSPFVFGLFVCSMLLLISVIFDMIDMLVSKGASFFSILKMFAFHLPNILSLSIPMAVLLGILIAYGRLSSDSEITIMKSSGLNYKTLTMPIIILVCAISLFLVYFNHLLAPQINFNQKMLVQELATKRPLLRFEEKSIKSIGNYNLYVNKVKSKDNALFGLSIYKFEDNDNNDKNNDKISIVPQKDKGAWRIAAPFAKIKICKNCIQLTLHNGYWQKAHPSNINNMAHMTFKTYVFSIPREDIAKNDRISISAIKTPELIKTIKQCQSQNIQTLAYERDLWFRWVVSFAPLAFVIIALPIGIMMGRGGKVLSWVISIGVTAIYYALLIISSSLGEKIPFGVIMWLPDFVIAIAGICLFIKMVKK
jgi:lipopolysaccharide export system permease protein